MGQKQETNIPDVDVHPEKDPKPEQNWRRIHVPSLWNTLSHFTMQNSEAI